MYHNTLYLFIYIDLPSHIPKWIDSSTDCISPRFPPRHKRDSSRRHLQPRATLLRPPEPLRPAHPSTPTSCHLGGRGWQRHQWQVFWDQWEQVSHSNDLRQTLYMMHDILPIQELYFLNEKRSETITLKEINIYYFMASSVYLDSFVSYFPQFSFIRMLFSWCSGTTWKMWQAWLWPALLCCFIAGIYGLV